MLGYLDDAEATAHTLDADGWLHTGDVGMFDDAGGWRIVDRLKELIKYKGYQVPPAMLEAVLLTHPAVVDACVVPVADEECGEIPKAFVVGRRGVGASLMAFVAAQVAPHERVREVEFVDEIPKSAGRASCCGGCSSSASGPRGLRRRRGDRRRLGLGLGAGLGLGLGDRRARHRRLVRDPDRLRLLAAVVAAELHPDQDAHEQRHQRRRDRKRDLGTRPSG